MLLLWAVVWTSGQLGAVPGNKQAGIETENFHNWSIWPLEKAKSVLFVSSLA